MSSWDRSGVLLGPPFLRGRGERGRIEKGEERAEAWRLGERERTTKVTRVLKRVGS